MSTVDPEANSVSSSSDFKTATFVMVGCLFFASGFSSLIYQVVWSRLLVFVFGSTTFATSAVLAVFMGGLALGSFAAGKFADRVRRPLVWYGILEGIIGVCALAVPFLLDSAIPIYKSCWSQFHSDPILFGLLRFFIATLVLILPTACMGATLPLVAKYIARNTATIGSRLGTLYATNTFGAVCGAALAGFVMLPVLGLKATTWTAAAINFALLLAVLAIPWERRLEVATPAAESELPQNKTKLPLKVTLSILAFGISGALSMIYEVGWTRALLLVIGSGTYAFTCMLSTFLIGIFIGSWLCARVIDKSKDPLRVFVILQIAASVCAMAALFCYSFLPIFNLVLGAFFAQSADAAIACKFFCAAATFVPLTLCIGATFPAIVRASVQDLDSVGKSVGTLYSANTCGAIAGAFLAGFCLVPWLGVEKMLLAAAVGNFALGAGISFIAPGIERTWRMGALALASCLMIGAIITPEVWDHRLVLLAQPLRRNHSDPKSIAAILFDGELRRQALAIIKVLYFADGVSSNVGVVRMNDSGHSLLLTNGNVDGGDSLDMGTQILLSLFPFMVRDRIKDVCVVGYGTGVSTGTALCFDVNSVTSIELEKNVYNAAKLFDHINLRPVEDPRSRFEMDDGRNFLLAANRQFDLIVSEPSNPWQAGVCNLYTREYFDICKQHLKEQGVLSCWLQTTELSPDSVRSILSALKSSFRHQLIFGTGQGPDIVILASDSPLQENWETIANSFWNPKAKLQFERAQLSTPIQVAACVKADTNTTAAICGSTAANTDDHNYLEFAVCKTYETSNFESANRQMFDSAPVQLKDVLKNYSAGNPSVLDLARTALDTRRPKQAIEWAKTEHANAQALCLEGNAQLLLSQPAKAEALWQEALTINARDDSTLIAMAKSALERKDAVHALELCKKALAANIENEFANYYLGVTESLPAKSDAIVGDQSLSISPNPQIKSSAVIPASIHLSRACKSDSFTAQYPNACYLYALALKQNGDLMMAERMFRKYIRLQPNSMAGKRALAELLWSQGKSTEAASLWTSSIYAGRLPSNQLTEEADQLIQQGKLQEAYDKLVQALDLCPANFKAIELVNQIAAKIPESKQLLRMLQKTGADDAAQQAKRLYEPPNDNAAKLIELIAAAFLLWIALNKNKSKS